MEFPIKSVFLALPLEGQPKQLFQELQEKLAPYADILRFQNPHSPHLTLMFWPEVSELEYKGIAEQAAKIASRHQAFTIDVIGADTFGSPSYAEASAGRRGEDRVLYLSVAFSDALARIKKDCPWSDGKPFDPHITLARIRHPQKFAVHKKKIMKILKGTTFPVPLDRLRLYGEINGVKQTLLEEVSLL